MNPVEFKDLPGLVGQEVGVSDWLEITQERVNQFAEAKAGGMQQKNECTIEIEGETKPACIAETISVVYGA